MSRILKGSLFALFAFFCMAVFGILTKVALQSGSVIWVSFLTYLAGALLLSFITFPKGLRSIQSNRYSYLIGRAVFGSVASFLYTISIQYIPIVNGTLLFNTAPIFIPILALIFLKAHLTKNIWLAVVVGFIGIVVMIRPTEAIFTQAGNLIGLASGISLAVAYLLMKLLTSTDPGYRIIFYYLTIGMLIQIPLLFFANGLPPFESCFYSFLAGIVLAVAQFGLVKAYQYAEASQVGIYQYTTIIFVGLIDWLLWGSVPNSWDLLGIFLVAVAGMIIIKEKPTQSIFRSSS